MTTSLPIAPPKGPPAWRVLPLRVAEPATLIEEGLALLDGLAQDPTPTLRWYRSSAPAVIVGRGQQAVLQRLATAAGSLPVVGRSSGGGAVLMDSRLLSLDVVVPGDHPLAAGELGAVFERVGEAWSSGLSELGVPGLSLHRGAATARLRGSPSEQALAAICYATLGRGEVLAGGRKLVGLAQRRRRHGVLVQCGLLRRWEPAALLALLSVSGDDALTRAVQQAAVGLEDLMGAHAPGDGPVMAAVQRRLGGGHPRRGRNDE